MRTKLTKIIRFIKYRAINLIISFHSFEFYLKFRNAKIVIFDIDNTISDTWPLFLIENFSNKERWTKSAPFEKMTKLILNYLSDGFTVVYLTARPWSAKRLTVKWLKSYNLPYKHVYTTITAANKVNYLMRLEQQFDYYDDLTYGAETGEVKFYKEVVDFINKKRNITYFDYFKLLSIQSEDAQ